MAQHDLVIDNAPGLAVRTDINAAFQAVATNYSGPTEPPTKYPGMWWLDTSIGTNGTLRLRNLANSAWVEPPAGAAQYVAKAGDTMTGNLIVPQLLINKAVSTNSNAVLGTMAGLNRWAVEAGDNGAETGSNAGSDFAITRFNDAGAFLGYSVRISRATGIVTATGLPPKPQTAVGIGQWFRIVSAAMGAALILPAGGTWAYLFIGGTNTALLMAQGISTGIDAGGTTVAAATANVGWSGMAWRIA